MKSVRYSVLGAALLYAAVTAGSASATMIVTPAGGATGVNVIDAACSAPTGAPAATIFGCFNTDHNLQVRFDTTDGQIDFAAGGQAKITAASSYGPGYKELKISIPGHTFEKMILNIEAQSDGSVTFTNDLGDVVVASLSGAGNNFFTITGDDFSWIEFSTGDGTYGTKHNPITDGNIVDVKQVRFDGLDAGGSENPPPSVPEPATLAMFGTALAGVSFLRRRRKRK